jgi:hypothetical protein
MRAKLVGRTSLLCPPNAWFDTRRRTEQRSTRIVGEQSAKKWDYTIS